MIDTLCDELDRLCDAPWRQLDAIDVLLAQIEAEIEKEGRSGPSDPKES